MKNRYEKFVNSESQTIPNQSVSLRTIVESSLNGNSLGVNSQIRDVKYDDPDSFDYDPLNSFGLNLDEYQFLMTEQTRKATEAKRKWREKKAEEAKEAKLAKEAKEAKESKVAKEVKDKKVSRSEENDA